MSKVTERKAKLHADLLMRAQNLIAERGVDQLRARDLAQDVGCSVGAIYNVVKDIDSLVLQVSGETLFQIDNVMAESQKRSHGKSATVALVDLSDTYFDFVVENTNLWRALFEHALPANIELPDWIVERQVALLSHIKEPLASLMPNASDEELLSTARLLFSAVHGVVNLAVDQRTTGLPLGEVKDRLEFLVGMFVAGVQRAD